MIKAILIISLAIIGIEANILQRVTNNHTEHKNGDEVLALPGLKDKLNFRHFSGYLQGAIAENKLHYWFVESQNEPSKDPVVLWLNGGPGCSSLAGMLSENGPFFVQDDSKTVKVNPYSWNKRANVIYLEAPVGVGFSLNIEGKNFSKGDNKTAADNYAALQDFFNKYPEFRNNEFFITGESYGGVYIPTLSELILNGKSGINLKGVAIGNGLYDYSMNGISSAFYYHYHGFANDKYMAAVVNACCKGSYRLQDCTVYNDGCRKAIINIDLGRLNIYNVFQVCKNPVERTKYTAKFGQSPCFDLETLVRYLNQPTVRKAIHINPKVQRWEVCSQILHYNVEYPSVLGLLEHMAGKIRILMYNGDFDTVCNFLGGEWVASNLKRPLLQAKKPYLVNGLTAGFKTVYKNLTFITVKGAGHMVPRDQPETIFKVINEFFTNTF